jgi:hypothetical protein
MSESSELGACELDFRVVPRRMTQPFAPPFANRKCLKLFLPSKKLKHQLQQFLIIWDKIQNKQKSQHPQPCMGYHPTGGRNIRAAAAAAAMRKQ